MRSFPVFLLAAILALGCGEPPAGPAASNAVPDPAWVTVYDPELAWNGYTLTLHRARVPVLLDMNGRTVHSWPEARVKSRVRLLPDGSLLGIGLGREVVEYDWEGRKTWEFRTPGAIPHHDILRLANGNTLVLVLREGEGADTLLEVDRAGKVVWTWRAIDHLGGLIPAEPEHPHDLTHINSLQELPENLWHAAGDRRFRPGNLLLSARSLNTIFIIDRQSGEVVWSFSLGLDRQHEARMNGPRMPSPGRIQLFNNRPASYWSDHRSELLEIDPRGGSVVWRHRAPGFFSPTGGTQQALPNGNLLVTSTRGKRVFEVTRRGRIVWEWAPPRYEPGRAARVARDACPQLARLDFPAPSAVVPPPGYRHVDGDAYRFARRGSRTGIVVEGTKRFVLKEENECRDLTLPAEAKVRVGYGVNRKRLRDAGRAERPPEFVLRLRPEGSPEVELLRDAVGLDGPAWRQRTIPLDAYSLRSVRLCVQVENGTPQAAGKTGRFAFWEQPFIATPGGLARLDEAGETDGDASPDDLTPEELEVRRKHLKTLGYVG